MYLPLRPLRGALIAVLAISLTLPAVRAANFTWNGTTSGDWSTNAWSGGGAPTGTDPSDTLIFGENAASTNYTATNEIDVGGDGGTDPFLLNGLTLGGTNNGSNNTTSTVTLATAGNGGVLRFTAGTGVLSLTATNSPNGRAMVYNVEAPVEFLGDFNLSGSGNATFNFHNVTLPSLWNATLGGSARANFLNSQTLGNDINLTGAGAGTLSLGGGTGNGTVLAGNITINVATAGAGLVLNNLTETGGPRSLTKNGSGSVTITTGANPYTGTTVINSGNLFLTYSGANNTVSTLGDGQVALNGGSFIFGRSGTTGSVEIANNFTVTGTGSRIGGPSSTSQTYAWSGNLNLGGSVTFGVLSGGGGGGPGNVWTGNVVIDQGAAGTRELIVMSGGNHGPEIRGSITDGAGGAGNALTLRSGDSSNGRPVTINGSANTYSGGTIIAAPVSGNQAVVVTATSKLGTGSVTINSGGILQFGALTNLDASQTTLTNNGQFQINYGGLHTGFSINGTGSVNKVGGGVTTLAAGTGGYSGGTIVSGSALGAASLTEFGVGNINLSGGKLVLGGSGTTWSDFMTNRSGGYGTGNNTWQISGQGGGFAALGSDVTILVDNTGDNPYGNTSSYRVFDRDWQMGLGGNLSSKNVTLSQNITLSSATNRVWRAAGTNAENRTWTIGNTFTEVSGVIDGGAVGRNLTLAGNGGNDSTSGGTIKVTNANNTFSANIVVGGVADTGASAIAVFTSDGAFGNASNTVTVRDSARGSDALLMFEDVNGAGSTTFTRSFTVQASDGSAPYTGFGGYAGDVVHVGNITFLGTRAEVNAQVHEGTMQLGTNATAESILNNRGGVNVTVYKTGTAEMILKNLTYAGNATNTVWQLVGGTLTTALDPAATGNPDAGVLRASGNLSLDSLFNAGNTNNRTWKIIDNSQTYNTGTTGTRFEINTAIDVAAGLTLTTNQTALEFAPDVDSSVLRKLGDGTWVFQNANTNISTNGANGYVQVETGTFDTQGDMGDTRLRLAGGTILAGDASSFAGDSGLSTDEKVFEITSAGGKLGISVNAAADVSRSANLTAWDQSGNSTVTLAARDNWNLVFGNATFPDIAAGTTLRIERDGSGTGAVQLNDNSVSVAGTVSVNGTLSGDAASDALVIEATGLLRGNGTVNRHITNNGTVTPGTSPGNLTVGNYTQQAGGALTIEVTGAPASTSLWDRLTVLGDALLDGVLNVIYNASATVGDIWKFLTTTGTRTGNFATTNISATGLAPNTALQVNYLSDGVELELVSTGNNSTVTYDTWKLAYWPSPDANDDWDDDADQDGNINLVEYALDTDPLTPDLLPLTVGESGGNLTLSYDRPGGSNYRSDLNYVTQRTTDLSGTSLLNTDTPTGSDADPTTVNVPSTTAYGSVDREFLDLRIEFTAAPAP